VRLAPAARRALSFVQARSAGGPLDRRARITLHFHPERDFGGRSVLASLLRDGAYRSQFETGTSNGGLTAHPGGDRWRWESRLFGGAYDTAPASARPVYGSLDFRRRACGGSPRFGSAFFRLREDALDRATFCYPDSVTEPVHFGTAERAGIVAIAAAGGPLEDASREPLDDYVEAHVHGGVMLATDVEALVLDPCFRGTPVEQAARQLPCPVEWHAGFVLSLGQVRSRPGFRSPQAARLAAAIAVDGILDARILGEAAARHDPQAVKHVWHYIACFGRPAAAGGPSADHQPPSISLGLPELPGAALPPAAC
jgi:hypothetical protein